MANTKKRTNDSVGDSPKAKKSAPPPATYQKYVTGEKIFSEYRGQLYEAKVIELQEKEGEHGYFIHYQGWNKRYDEFVPESKAQTQFRKFDPETAEAAKKEAKEAKESRRSSASIKTPKLKQTIKKESVDATASESEAESVPKSIKPRKTGTPAVTKTPKTPKASTSKRLSNLKLEAAAEIETPTISGTKSNRIKALDPEYVEEITKSINKVIIDSTTTKALIEVLVEDRERIYRRDKLPKIPAQSTIVTIMQEFLKSKNTKMEEMSDEISEDFENALLPANSKPEELIKCLVNLFDCTVQSFLLYPIEKELFETMAKAKSGEIATASNGKTILRTSNRVGLPYLMRMFSRLNIILGSGLLDVETVNHFVSIVKDLGSFLSKNQHRFYKPEDYYRTPTSDYLKRLEGSST